MRKRVYCYALAYAVLKASVSVSVCVLVGLNALNCICTRESVHAFR